MSKTDMNQMPDMQLRIFEKEHIECRDVDKLLGDYVEMELPLSLRARVHAHIKRCDACTECEESYRDVIKIASTLREKPISSAMQNRLRRGLNQRLGINLPLVK